MIYTHTTVASSSNVERMIRQSSALSDVQQQLNEAYLAAVAKIDKNEIMKLKSDHATWLKQRDLCKDHDCIHTSLMKRLTKLDRLNKP